MGRADLMQKKVAPGWFTQVPDGNALVAMHIKTICQFITDRLGNDLKSLILVGSFGRGEGSMHIAADGLIHPVNDYDFLVVLKKSAAIPAKNKITEWETSCAALTGVRWVDLTIISERHLSFLRPTQFNYDLKWSGQVVCGDNTVLSLVPEYHPQQLPLREAQILLSTRFWCFIGTWPERLLAALETFDEDEQTFILEQLSKALIAAGDSLLMLANQYRVLYRDKEAVFGSLPDVTETERRLIGWGYAFKLARTQTLPAGYTLRELYLAALKIHLDTWKTIKRQVPFLKSIYSIRFLGGFKQWIRRGSLDGFRWFLLDVIQYNFLQNILKVPGQLRVSRFCTFMLWMHCGLWISLTTPYASQVARLRLEKP